MSVAEKINSIKEHVTNAYTAISKKNGTIPTNKNIENLESAINSIASAKEEVADTITIKANGTNILRPDEGKVFSQVTITTDVGSSKPEQTKDVTITTNGDSTVTPDDGYVLSAVNISTAVQPKLRGTVIITPDSSEHTVTPGTGYDGLSKVIVNKTPLSTDTVTPTKSTQNVQPHAGTFLSHVIVNPIPDEYIEPSGTQQITENGTYDITDKAEVVVNVSSAAPTQEKTVTITENGTQEVTPDADKVLTKVTITTNVQPNLQEKSVTPSMSSITVTPDEAYNGLSKVVVSPIPSKYIDTTDATATATDILSGKTAYVNGSKIMGTIATYDGSYEDIVPVKTLEESSWAEIDAACTNGTASSKWAVGDEKTITLSASTEYPTDQQTVTLQILGFNHDDLADGSGKATITFGMKDLLTQASNNMMDTGSAGNSNSWKQSRMRTVILPMWTSRLPSDLQSIIKEVTKKTTAGAQSKSIITTTDKLFLFSKVEIDGDQTAGYVDEGTQYEYWQNHNTDADRIKKLKNGIAGDYPYWLRSPSIYDSTNYCGVSLIGSMSATQVSNYGLGICFCFCVGKASTSTQSIKTYEE